MNDKFEAIIPRFTSSGKKGKRSEYRSWSGKSLRKMAGEVDHLEAYDIFYTELSSFAHLDVHSADHFLKCPPDGPLWSQRANEYDVGNIFRYAASFLSCFLVLFGRRFGTFSEVEVKNCWNVKLDRQR